MKILTKNGWYEIRQTGSHKIMKKEGIAETIIFAYHKRNEVPTGTCIRILKQAGIK